MKYYTLLVLFSILDEDILVAVNVTALHDVTDTSPGQVYWNKVLPNTPIPSAIKELLTPLQSDKSGTTTTVTQGSSFGRDGTDIEAEDIAIGALNLLYHGRGGDETQINSNRTLYFLEKDLHPGSKSTWQFGRAISTRAKLFVSQREASSIPFTSAKFPEILKHFSIQADSVEAKSVNKTLSECENPAMNGESKYCATSLESMIEFGKATIGTTNIRVVSTNIVIDKKENINSVTKLQQYTVVSSSNLKSGSANLVVCHAERYAYVVFYCHSITDTKVYQVQMVGKDGTKVDTVAVCHGNTAEWNPEHVAFRLLHVKPGTVPICHFINQGSLVWAPKNN